jgi:hypothetical protein
MSSDPQHCCAVFTGTVPVPGYVYLHIMTSDDGLCKKNNNLKSHEK